MQCILLEMCETGFEESIVEEFTTPLSHATPTATPGLGWTTVCLPSLIMKMIRHAHVSVYYTIRFDAFEDKRR